MANQSIGRLKQQLKAIENAIDSASDFVYSNSPADNPFMHYTLKIIMKQLDCLMDCRGLLNNIIKDKQNYTVVSEKNEQTTKEEFNMTLDDLILNIKVWAKEREIDKQSADAGYRKTIEELGELSSAYSRQNTEMMADSLGDATVCLINLATQMGLDFKECLEMAYNEISDRKGKMVNGVFVKEADLKNGKDNQ